MQERRLRCDTITYTTLIRSYEIGGHWQAAFDILEFELSDMLSALGENIENYKKDILIDENSSTHAI